MGKSFWGRLAVRGVLCFWAQSELMFLLIGQVVFLRG